MSVVVCCLLSVVCRLSSVVVVVVVAVAAAGGVVVVAVAVAVVVVVAFAVAVAVFVVFVVITASFSTNNDFCQQEQHLPPATPKPDAEVLLHAGLHTVPANAKGKVEEDPQEQA